MIKCNNQNRDNKKSGKGVSLCVCVSCIVFFPSLLLAC